LITLEQEEKLSKTTLIVVLPKSIPDTYLETIMLETPSSLLAINTISETPNKTKNSSMSTTPFELPILPPSVNFQLFKRDKNSEVKTTTNRVTCFSAAKYKLDDKTNKPQKQAKTILAILDWFSDENRIIEEEVVIVAYIAKHNITIPKSYKKTINNPKYAKQ
jgi:hypothetical protein